MREVKEVALPAGQRVSLGESGYHLMLIGLNAPLKEGDAVPLTLSVRLANKQVVKVETKAAVKPLTEAKPAPQDGGHMMHHNHQ